MTLPALNYKKIILIATFIIACLSIGFLMYLMFFRTLPPPATETPVATGPGSGVFPEPQTGTDFQSLGGGTQTGGTPIPLPPEYQAAKTGVETVEANSTLGLTLGTGGTDAAFYDAIEEKFFRISSVDGEKTPLSNEKFYQVQDVIWNNNSDAAILSYPDGLKVYYDFATGKKATLPREVTDPVFSSDGQQISFKYETSNADGNYLAVSKPDGTEGQLIEPLGNEGSKMQTSFAPDKSVVAFYERPASLNSSEILFVGQAGENYRSLNITGTHFKAIWSPSGKKILYHTVLAENGFKPNLWLAGGPNGLAGSINIDLATWVDKCLFVSDAEVYCAVPESLPDGAGLYPDEVATMERDLIYRLDLGTGEKKLVAYPFDGETPGFYKINKIALSSDGRTLFFSDEYSNKIYKMVLK
jgi:Tol biopolymer transport system component